MTQAGAVAYYILPLELLVKGVSVLERISPDTYLAWKSRLIPKDGQ